MLLSNDPKLSDAIVSQFALVPVATAAEILRAIGQTYRKLSHVAIYAELNNLIDRGVVVKDGRQFRLSFHWVLSLSHFAESLYSRYVSADLLSSTLPAPGTKVKWKFSSLRRMDNFWVQLFFLLFSRSPSRVLYEWAPHAWFSFLDVELQRQYMEVHRKGNFHVYMIVGDDSVLDRAAAATWDPATYHWSFAKGPFEGDPKYYSVIDDYVLTVTLEPGATKKLDQLFGRVKRMNDFNLMGFYRIVDGASRSSITLEHNAKKAARMSKQFREYFGLREKL